MQPMNKTISTEAEFKAACIADGDKAISLLKYLQTDYHMSMIATDKQSARDKLYHKYHNVSELITTISNARHESAPQLDF